MSNKHAPKDIVSWLASSNDGQLEELYKDEFTALTVFRSLRGLAKQYVMNLVLLENAVWEEQIEQWTLESSNSHHKAALHKLLKYKILQCQAQKRQSGPNGADAAAAATPQTRVFWLNQSFKKCVRSVLLCKSGAQLSDITLNPADLGSRRITSPSVETLQRHAKSKWDKVLETLGANESNGMDAGPAQGRGPIQQLLVQVGLLVEDSYGQLSITSDGFKFLFQDIHTQIWQVIIAYIESAENRGLTRVEIIKFLFKLSFLTPGNPYSRKNASLTVTTVIDDLIHLGIVYGRPGNNKKSSNIKYQLFYPTNLAKFLSSGQSLTKTERDSQGFIVVEATFKVYAYTKSALQIDLLSKFIRLEYQLPNLISGKITKQSIMNAIQKGIPIDLIVEYLTKYAHPLMRKNYPVLPINVIDQMRLWESENSRLKITPAFMVSMIESDEAFDTYCHVVNSRENDERSTMLADAGAPQCAETMIQKIDAFANENKLYDRKDALNKAERARNANVGNNGNNSKFGQNGANRRNRPNSMGRGANGANGAKGQKGAEGEKKDNLEGENEADKAEEWIDESLERVINFWKGDFKDCVWECKDLEREDVFLYKRYLVIMKKYGWNEKEMKWTKSTLSVRKTVNNLILAYEAEEKASDKYITSARRERKDMFEAQVRETVDEAFYSLANDLMALSDELCAIHLTQKQMDSVASKLLWSHKAEKTIVLTPAGVDKLKRHRQEQKLLEQNGGGGRSGMAGMTANKNNKANNANNGMNGMQGDQTSGRMQGTQPGMQNVGMQQNMNRVIPQGQMGQMGQGGRQRPMSGQTGNMGNMGGVGQGAGYGRNQPQRRPQTDRSSYGNYNSYGARSSKKFLSTTHVIQTATSRHAGKARTQRGDKDDTSMARQQHWKQLNRDRVLNSKYNSDR